jgi:hypothetical protein
MSSRASRGRKPLHISGSVPTVRSSAGQCCWSQPAKAVRPQVPILACANYSGAGHRSATVLPFRPASGGGNGLPRNVAQECSGRFQIPAPDSRPFANVRVSARINGCRALCVSAVWSPMLSIGPHAASSTGFQPVRFSAAKKKRTTCTARVTIRFSVTSRFQPCPERCRFNAASAAEGRSLQ